MRWYGEYKEIEVLFFVVSTTIGIVVFIALSNATIEVLSPPSPPEPGAEG